MAIRYGTRGRPALALSPEAPCADETDLTCICDEVARHVPSFECAVGVSAFGSVRSAEDLVQQVLEPSVG